MEKELPPGRKTYAGRVIFSFCEEQKSRTKVSSGGIKEVDMEYEIMYNFDRLYETYKKCRRGKTQKTEVIQFELNLSEELIKLQEEL